MYSNIWPLDAKRPLKTMSFHLYVCNIYLSTPLTNLVLHSGIAIRNLFPSLTTNTQTRDALILLKKSGSISITNTTFQQIPQIKIKKHSLKSTNANTSHGQQFRRRKLLVQPTYPPITQVFYPL